jgi:hypothetical protein
MLNPKKGALRARGKVAWIQASLARGLEEGAKEHLVVHQKGLITWTAASKLEEGAKRGRKGVNEFRPTERYRPCPGPLAAQRLEPLHEREC